MSVEPSALSILQHRRDFLAAARARKSVTDGFIVQFRPRKDASDQIRVGFTASKKVGNAVIRNRAKRRMRALAREILPVFGQTGSDYVLIARHTATIQMPYDSMLNDLQRAVERLKAGKKP